MNNVYAVKIGYEIEKVVLEKLMKRVTSETRERVKRFFRVEDLQRSLVGELLLRHVLYEVYDMPNKDLIFEKNEFGKLLLSNSDRIHFNLSHAGNWVVCAFGDKQIGIDVEFVRQIDIEIGESFFSREEYSQLCVQPEDRKLRHFYNLWTLKESYAKAVGMGFSLLSSSYSICFLDNSIHLKYSPIEGTCYFKQFNIDDDHILSVCGFQDEFCEKVKIINILDFNSLEEICNKE